MGFEDTRGTLFFEIARIAERRKPQILFLENVKGLLSHDRGRTFAVILATLDELGYNAEWQVLNSKYFGVPQNRERVFIIGHLRGKSSRQVFPIKQIEEPDIIIPTLTARYKADSNGSYISYPKEQGEINQEGISNTLSRVQKDNLLLNIKKTQYGKHQQDCVYDVDGISPTIPQGTHGSTPHLLKIILDTPYSMGNSKPNRSAIGSQRVPEIGNNERSIRRLTEIECERLQGFPDKWTEGVSATQRYKQLGNAVTVNVIDAIIKKLNKELA